MSSSQSQRRIRFKCRYEGEIRTVTVTSETGFAELRRRLSSDYGFDVSLKYQDSDGDTIILASQNDLDDIFLYGDSDTINVFVSETLSLPNLLMKGTVTSARGSTAGTASLYNTSAVNTGSQLSTNFATTVTSARDLPKPAGADPSTVSSISTVKSQSTVLRPVNSTRMDRFPNIAENSANRQQEVTNIRWKRGEILGQGAFGVVYLGLNIDSGELMAVKQMATEDVSKRELSSLENEIHLLRNLRHPNIVRYIGTELNPESMSIFLEYVPGGSLKALIDKFGALEESVARSYTRQLLIGLEYLHRHGIAHRDIKGANCLVGNDGVIKLADFGNSKHWRPPTGTGTLSGIQGAAGGAGAGGKGQTSSGDIKGTPSWMAPEVIRDEGGGISWRKADIWSLGCTTVEMTTGKAPWKQFNNPVTIMYHIACQDTLPEYPDPASFELITFLNTCLQRDPKMRPDVTSLLMHPFVSHIVVPAGGGAGGAGGATWSNPSHQFQNRPTTVAHSVVGAWDRTTQQPQALSLTGTHGLGSQQQQGIPAVGIAAGTAEGTSTVVSMANTPTPGVTPSAVVATPRTTTDRQVYTFEREPASRPDSARGPGRTALTLAAPGQGVDGPSPVDPELALEVDHAQPTLPLGQGQPLNSLSGTPVPAVAAAVAAAAASVAGTATVTGTSLPGRHPHGVRLAAINHPSSTPSSARSPKTRAASGGAKQSPGVGSSGKVKRTKKKSSARQAGAEVASDRNADSPGDAAALLGGMEAQLARLLADGGGAEKGQQADPPSMVETATNEDDIETPPTTLRVPKLALSTAADSLFHKSPLAPADAGASDRGDKYGAQHKSDRKGHRRGDKTTGFESFDSEDASSWYTGPKYSSKTERFSKSQTLPFQDHDADSIGAGMAADDDTLYSATGYSSAEGGGDDLTFMSGTGAQRTERASSSVRSRGDSNVLTSYTSSPVGPQPRVAPVSYDMGEAGAKVPDMGYPDVFGAKDLLKPSFSKSQVITGPVSWKRLGTGARAEEEQSGDLPMAGEKAASKGTSLIKPTALKTPSNGGWRKHGTNGSAVSGAAYDTSIPSAQPYSAHVAAAEDAISEELYEYDATLTRRNDLRSYGDSLNAFGTAEEVPDDPNTLLHGDSTALYGDSGPVYASQHAQPHSRQHSTQARRTSTKSGASTSAAATRHRDREKDRETAPNDGDNPTDLSAMSVSGMNLDTLRISTAIPGSLSTAQAPSTASGQSLARTAAQGMRTSNSRKALHPDAAAASTPTGGMSRHGSRQPMRTANRMHRDRDREEGDPLDMSCDSLDRLQVTGTAAKGDRDRDRDREREGTAKGTGAARSSKRAPTATQTASGSRRAHANTAPGPLPADDDVNMSATVDDRDGDVVPEGLFSSAPVSLDEHTAAVTRLRAPERTALLLSSSLDGTIRIWGPDQSSEDTAGSRAVLETAGFKTDNTYSAYPDQRPERRVTLGAGGDDSSIVTGGSSARGAAVKITNMWVDDACETIWATCSDAALRVWSGGEGRPLRLLKGHEDQITAMEGMDAGSSGASHLLQSSVSGNPSSSLVATGSSDRTVRVWDVRAKKAQVFSFRGHGDTVLVLRWNEGGRSLVSAGKDKTVRIWDTRAGRLRVTLEKHFGSVNCVRVMPPGLQGGAGASAMMGNSGYGSAKLESEAAAVVSAGRDSMINVWTASGDCLSSQAAHRGTVSFLSDINYSTGGGGYSHLYTTQQGLNAKSVYASPFGTNPLMLSLGTDGAIKLWDLRRYKCVSELAPSAQTGSCSKAVWCAQGFLTAGNTGVVRLYEHCASAELAGGLGTGRDINTAGDGMEYVARSGSGSPGALPYGSALLGLPPAAHADWQVRDLAVHAGASACTDLLCTEGLCASASKSGQILRWRRQ